MAGGGIGVELEQEECIRMMQEFIAKNPGLWEEDTESELRTPALKRVFLGTVSRP
jgi:hypothetical protein